LIILEVFWVQGSNLVLSTKRFGPIWRHQNLKIAISFEQDVLWRWLTPSLERKWDIEVIPVLYWLIYWFTGSWRPFGTF